MLTLIILILGFIVVFILLLILYLLARPIMRGAVYYPTSKENVDTIIQMANLKPAQKIVDVGSGDGRILIGFAKQGIQAVGYEINPLLVFYSRRAIQRAGVSNRVMVYWKSFWSADLSEFDVVIIYGIPHIMKGLQKKLARELKPGAKVISNIYAFPDWQPREIKNKIYLYSFGD